MLFINNKPNIAKFNIVKPNSYIKADLLYISCLISLEKLDRGIRLIAIGDLIYKVAIKAILKTTFSSSILLPF
jgi:hypothetical protein